MLIKILNSFETGSLSITLGCCYRGEPIETDSVALIKPRNFQRSCLYPYIIYSLEYNVFFYFILYYSVILSFFYNQFRRFFFFNYAVPFYPPRGGLFFFFFFLFFFFFWPTLSTNITNFCFSSVNKGTAAQPSADCINTDSTLGIF